MSTELKDTMVGYARDAEAPVDLGPVIRAGDRRRRVRAVVAGTAAVVTVFALAVGGTQLVGSLSDDGTPVAAARDVASYANGSHIYVGDETVDVGDHRIHAYVRTTNGFVFSDEDDDVFYVDGASVEQIGSGVVREGNLRADDDGSTVAWVDNGPEEPEFVVYDTESMTEILRTADGNDVNRGPNFETNPASIVALDGEDLYVINGRGLARVDIAADATEQIAKGGASQFDVMDAADGLILHKQPDEDVWWNDRKARILGPDYSSRGTRLRAFTEALSPDGRYAAGLTEAYNGQLRITSIESGRTTRMSSPEHDELFRPLWLDADTVLVAADRPGRHSPTDLARCDIGADRCETVATDLGTFGRYQLPDGQFESDEGL